MFINKVTVSLTILLFSIHRCGLKVLGVTCDGNSANRRFFKLHSPQADVYKVKNPFTAEDRQIFFMSDPPHLIKTTRNCWASQKRVLYVSDMNQEKINGQITIVTLLF